jgi:hypothetical protein
MEWGRFRKAGVLDVFVDRVLDRLVDYRILSSLEAVASLEIILERGSWLPEKECGARFKKWRG